MFTGIVQGTAELVAIEELPNFRTHVIRMPSPAWGEGLALGASVAHNGCCLTVVGVRGRGKHRTLEFDLLQETWKRTNLSDSGVGSCVNLERALAVGARLGGHFVTGHIDGTGMITRWERNGQDHVLDIAAPKEVRRYVVFKGSIAVDGVSLTLVDVGPDWFSVMLIPHTLAVTTLGTLAPGDPVNIEADMLAKHVRKLMGNG